MNKLKISILFLLLIFLQSCDSRSVESISESKPLPEKTDLGIDQKKAEREKINQHISDLVDNLINQPVMTPRSGFSGYLAHFNLIRTTLKDDKDSVIVDGEGYSADMLPYEYLALGQLKGAHPWGGTYGFSSLYSDGTGKDRFDPEARLVMEIPGPKSDGKIAIGFGDGQVKTFPLVNGPFDDQRVQDILSKRGGESL